MLNKGVEENGKEKIFRDKQKKARLYMVVMHWMVGKTNCNYFVADFS